MRRDRRRARLLLALLLLAAFTLVTVDMRGAEASPLKAIRARVGDVVGPVQQAVAGALRPVAALGEGFSGFGSGGKRMEELERANEELRRELNTSGANKERVAELDRLLHVAGAGQYRLVPARVVAIGPTQGFAWTVTIDAGERDGIRPDMSVVNGDGLVGRVKSVSAGNATVVLAADPSSAVGVRLENRQAGIAAGDGTGPLLVDLFNPATEVVPGDRLVTFGSRNGTPYAPGIPVGEVIEVQGITGSLTKRAKVRPYADPGALDLVGVIVEPPRTDPRNSVLPPRPPSPPPTPTPSATCTCGATASPSPGASAGPSGKTTSSPRPGTTSAPSSSPRRSPPPTSRPTSSSPTTSAPRSTPPATPGPG